MSSGKQTPTVSVVIPAYNEESVIVDCLRALLGQTMLPDEIIVVDNNSSDATVSLAAAVGGPVKVVHESKQGIAHARNAGFNAASSEIIGRIDADTIVAPDWIEKIKRSFAGESSHVGITGTACFYDHPYGQVADAIFNVCNHWGNRLISGSPILWGSNMAMRRSAWHTVKNQTNNDDNYWEDVDLSVRVRKLGRIVYSRDLRAWTSARSSLVSAAQLADYFGRWPRTYAQFGWRRAFISRVLYLSLAVFWLPGALARPIARQKELAKFRQQRLQRRLRAWMGI